MKTLVDGQILRQPEARRGIGVAFKQLFEEMVAHDITQEWYVGVEDEGDLEFFSEQVRARLTPVLVQVGTPAEELAARTARYTQSLQRVCDQHAIQAYWNPNPLMNNVLLPTDLRHVTVLVTIYDLIPWVLRATYLDQWPAHVRHEYERRLRALPTWADALCFISASARDDFLRLAPAARARSRVIHLAADHARFSPLGMRPSSSRDPYVLFTGGFDPRKNMSLAVEGFARLIASDPAAHARLKLHIVCAYQESDRAAMMAHARQLNVADRLVLTGYVEEERLAELYQQASAFFFPSRYEGFGLPIVEALACGVPVVTTRLSSLPEVAGDHACYCDADDPQDMARALALALSQSDDHELRRARVEHARQFTWSSAAAKYARLFSSTVLARGRAQVKSLPKVAMATPWPPQRTGVAHFNQTLANHLRKQVDLTLYVEDPSACDGERFGLPMRELASLPTDRHGFDAVVYHVGNNTAFHRRIYQLAWQHPGIVVLHDYNIHPFLADAFQHTPDEWLFDAAIEEGHGITRTAARAGELNVFDYPLCHALAKRSLATIVHSQWVRQQLKEVARVFAVPLGSQCAAESARDLSPMRQRLRLQPGQFVISTLGFINKLKRVPSMLEAVKILVERGYPLQFVIGGSLVDPALMIEDKIQTLGLTDHVSISGFLSDEDFEDVIRLSDVVLNLRFPSMGETSGTLMQSFGHGKACIVSQFQQYADFPDSVCWKVDVDELEIPQLVAYLEHLLRNPGVRRQLGENARNYVARYASWEHVAELHGACIQATCAAAKNVANVAPAARRAARIAERRAA